MSLSEEQLRRIEENKKRAQQKLLERKRPAPSAGNSVASSKKIVTEIPSRNSTKATKASCTNFYSHKKSFTDGRNQQSSSNTFNKPSYGGKNIKLDFTLVSKTRFEVVCPYQAAIIEVFKQIPSRSYGKQL